MKIEIKSRLGSKVLFVAEVASLKLAVEAAVKSGANLHGADLRGANLSSANLYGADLSSAKNAELPIARTVILGTYIPDSLK